MNYSAQVEALPLWCPPRLEAAWRDLEQRRCIWVRLQRWRQVKKCLDELDAIYNLATTIGKRNGPSSDGSLQSADE